MYLLGTAGATAVVTGRAVNMADTILSGLDVSVSLLKKARQKQ
jgi:hypothetical protein